MERSISLNPHTGLEVKYPPVIVHKTGLHKCVGAWVCGCLRDLAIGVASWEVAWGQESVSGANHIYEHLRKNQN